MGNSFSGDVNAVNGDGVTALYLSCSEGNVEAVKSLLQAGANITQGSEGAMQEGRLPIHAAAGGNHVEVVKLLLDAGADVNAKDPSQLGYDYTPAFLAVSKGNLPLLQLLITRGADVNVQDNIGFTPLTYAAAKNKMDFVKALLEAGAQINGANSKAGDQRTALHWACATNNFELVKFLTEKGADVANLDLSSETPLRIAFVEEYFDIVRFLLTIKAEDVSLDDIDYITQNTEDKALISMAKNAKKQKRRGCF